MFALLEKSSSVVAVQLLPVLPRLGGADAADCARAIGLRYDTVPIAPAVEGITGMLAPVFAGR